MNEDGSRLWLRYDALPQATAARYAGAIHGLLILGASDTLRIVRDELTHGLRGLLKRDVQAGDAPPQTGSVLVGTASASDVIRAAVGGQLDNLGPEGFVLTSTLVGGQPMTILAGQTDVGVLYAAFHFLRLLQTGQPIDRLAVASRRRVRRRLLNHWDNLDRSIERGYAGRSLWEWDKLPGELSPRYTAYARANASIGINGTVLNNVNANPLILSPDYLKKVAAKTCPRKPPSLVPPPPLGSQTPIRPDTLGSPLPPLSPRGSQRRRDADGLATPCRSDRPRPSQSRLRTPRHPGRRRGQMARSLSPILPAVQ